MEKMFSIRAEPLDFSERLMIREVVIGKKDSKAKRGREGGALVGWSVALSIRARIDVQDFVHRGLIKPLATGTTGYESQDQRYCNCEPLSHPCVAPILAEDRAVGIHYPHYPRAL